MEKILRSKWAWPAFYQLRVTMSAAGWMYAILIALFLTLRFLTPILAPDASANINSPEIVSAIFLFAIGASCCNTNLPFFSACGISRRTSMAANTLSLFVSGLLMAAADSVLPLLYSLMWRYRSGYLSLYAGRYAPGGYSLHAVMEGWLWLTALYLLMALSGLFMACLFYRMKKWMKTAFWVCVPACVFIVIPSIDLIYFDSRVALLLARLLAQMLGFAEDGRGIPNPFIGVFTMLILCALFAALSWLLIRKAPIRQR